MLDKTLRRKWIPIRQNGHVYHAAPKIGAVNLHGAPRSVGRFDVGDVGCTVGKYGRVCNSGDAVDGNADRVSSPDSRERQCRDPCGIVHCGIRP